MIKPTFQINRTVEIALLAALGGLAVAAFAVIGAYDPAAEVPLAQQLPWALIGAIFAGIGLVHAMYMLGWRRGLAFLAIAVIISVAFEYIGAKTGVIFGAYYYTDVLGPKLFDTVPVAVSLAYFTVIYASSVMASLMLTGKPDPDRLPLPMLIAVAFLSSLLMTAWDLILDPLMSGELGVWVWTEPGPYFGVPMQNFVGWVITTFTICLLYRLSEYVLPLRPLGRITRSIVLIPVVCYFLLWLGGLWLCDPVDTQMIGPFVMGIPTFMTLLRLFEPEGAVAAHLLLRHDQTSVERAS